MVYDTIIVGCGYTALGYAAANGATLICEERESIDVNFSLAARSFSYTDYEPKTDMGRELQSSFRKHSLIEDGRINATALETAAADFVISHGLTVYLKCRVIDVTREGEIFRVTLISNSGIEYRYTRKLLDMRCDGERIFTILFSSESDDHTSLISAINGSSVEPAFYKNRYALHTKVCKSTTYSDALVEITEKWEAIADGRKMLYAAPVFGYTRTAHKTDTPTDSDFDNPIEALECGVTLAKGGRI